MDNTAIRKVAEGVYRLSVNVQDLLFEGLWPLPHGVAMNSYAVCGERVALIDGVCDWDGLPETLLAQVAQMDIALEQIDYLVLNHLEPDHTGWLNSFFAVRPEAILVTTSKGAALAKAFYGFTDNIQIVGDGDSIDLGGGHSLEFYEVPNLHWPETMATFHPSSGTLFSCDAFGSFGRVDSTACYYDQQNSRQRELYAEETLRYYANIIAPFSQQVLRGLDKLAQLPINCIAPGHGLIWRSQPQQVMDEYRRLAGYARGQAEPAVTVIWGSMYGMTEKGLAPLLDGLQQGGVRVYLHRVPESHVSFILRDAWRSSGIVLGMPTYEYKMFPPMATVLDELGRKKVQQRLGFRFGSYGWSGGAQKDLDEILTRLRMNWDFLAPVEFKGTPQPADLAVIKQQGQALAEAVLERSKQQAETK